MKSHVAVVALMVGISFARADNPPASMPALPSTDELKASLAASDYPAVLAGASRVLALRNGPLAARYDRSVIWATKGEALVQSARFSAAADAFTASANEKNATDAQQTYGFAMAALFKASQPSGYTPHQVRQDGNPHRYDVRDSAKRFDALVAMTKVDQDEIAAHVADIIRFSDTQILSNTSALQKCVGYINERRPVEQYAEGNTAVLDGLELKVDDRYLKAIKDWHDSSLQFLAKFAELEAQTLNLKVNENGDQKPATVPRGLTSSELLKIKDLLNTCASYGEYQKNIYAASSDIGRTVVTRAAPLIQAVYDEGRDVYQHGDLPRSLARDRALAGDDHRN